MIMSTQAQCEIWALNSDKCISEFEKTAKFLALKLSKDDKGFYTDPSTITCFFFWNHGWNKGAILNPVVLNSGLMPLPRRI